MHAGEISFVHPLLCYKGKIDSLASYQGKLSLIEWKTSAKLKPTLTDTYDAPVQAAAYVGGLNHDLSFESLPEKFISQAVVVVSYENGSPATVHRLDMTKLMRHWKIWQDRLQLYWIGRLMGKTE